MQAKHGSLNSEPCHGDHLGTTAAAAAAAAAWALHSQQHMFSTADLWHTTTAAAAAAAAAAGAVGPQQFMERSACICLV
jgi:hypothetical protein